MPLVFIETGANDPERVAEIVDEVRTIVAEELSCDDPDGALEPSHVEVKIRERGGHDKSGFMLEIVILANDYPSRLFDLDVRQAKIKARIAAVCKAHKLGQWVGAQGQITTDWIDPEDRKGFVWVLLCPGSFGEFSY